MTAGQITAGDITALATNSPPGRPPTRSTTSPPWGRRARAGACWVLALLAAGCSHPLPPPPATAPQVGVVEVHAQPVPLTRNLVGRLSATRSADVRARVAGVLLKRLYVEGSDVKAGQPLFEIDPAPLRAALDGALAALAQAEATAANAHISAQRSRELLPSGLVSRSDLDNAEAAERSTAAAVSQAKAAVGTARINLGYATVTAPISGRAGQQGVTEGALVGQGTPTLLTTVEQIDPIYVNFDEPAVDIERLRRAQAAGNITVASGKQVRVQVLLADGAPYPHTGTLDFLDVSVDPATGAVALRGIVPNPDHLLLPGMFVGVRLSSAEVNRGYLVPQAGLQRDASGPYVLVAGPDNKVLEKRVTTEALEGPDWVVTAGLADGDRVIVSGTQNARPGTSVAAVPAPADTDAAHDAAGVAAGTGNAGAAR
ncbi:MAG: efflux RND transporter periplasmic adaptor subunit [Gammaproteobacteria bacterium]|nr:efflux RND transporter periplasmic adaptor subunit [Gammaproteobacteria bacterium]